MSWIRRLREPPSFCSWKKYCPYKEPKAGRQMRPGQWASREPQQDVVGTVQPPPASGASLVSLLVLLCPGTTFIKGGAAALT